MPIDYSQYPKNWKLISKFIRFYRAKNKCEWCGIENYQPHPEKGYKVVLTVAHLDQDIKNNSFFNLAALCQRCHLNHDRATNIRNRKYGKNHKQNQLSIFN